MCGRAAQTHYAVRAAEKDLNGKSDTGDSSGNRNHNGDRDATNGTSHTRSTHPQGNQQAPESSPTRSPSGGLEHNNFNMSPGMDAFVFWKDDKSQVMRMELKTWGLITKGGTVNSPLPENDIGLHFKNLMFNARSDTLFEKPTFARLANSRKSCLIAMDGFFEWKTELGKKQPYFVYRRKQSDHRPYLLFAGLWTSVSTGRSDNPLLETFTIITTEACAAIQWLHTRMPVVVWDTHLAQQWLDEPSPTSLKQLDDAARRTDANLLQWHAVSPLMSSMKYRTADAIKPVAQTKSVKSFFAVAASTETKTASSASGSNVPPGNRKRSTLIVNSPSSSMKSTEPNSRKKLKVATPQKRGPIDAFFKPKTTK